MASPATSLVDFVKPSEVDPDAVRVRCQACGLEEERVVEAAGRRCRKCGGIVAVTSIRGGKAPKEDTHLRFWGQDREARIEEAGGEAWRESVSSVEPT